jgi:integrase
MPSFVKFWRHHGRPTPNVRNSSQPVAPSAAAEIVTRHLVESRRNNPNGTQQGIARAAGVSRVPLSDAAMAILAKMAEHGTSGFVFPGMTAGKPLSNMAMLQVLRRMGRKGLTVHGFRSAFTDWCAEQTKFPDEVRKMAKAHAIGDKGEEAYRRGDLFAKRRQLAEAWAKYCGQARGQVITLKARSGTAPEAAG